VRQQRYRGGLITLAVVLTVFAGPVRPQTSLLEPRDPVFGTWILDVSKSKFLTRPAPRSQTRIYAPSPQGLKGTVITVAADGTQTTTEFIGRYDGVDYPFAGRPDADAIALERTGQFTASSTFFHAGKAIGGALRTISPDGKQLTIQVELQGAISSIEVFRKQE
jgi:hypothetical protein